MLAFIIVILLMLSAVAILYVRSKKLAKIIAVSSLGVSFVFSLVLLRQASAGAALLITYGAQPWGLIISVTPLEAYMACLFTGIGSLAAWSSVSTIESDLEASKVPLFYALVCLLISMLCSVVFFDHVIYVFITIEFSAFVAAGIVIIKNNPENIRAGLKYLTLSILGSGLVLLGIIILYTQTGALSFQGIRSGINEAFADSEQSIIYALVFITIGISLKSALFPFHVWLPDAHAYAPSTSSALLSSLVLKAFIVFYIKVLYRAIGVDLLETERIRMLLRVVMIMGVASMLFGSLMALLQTDLKRMIAYSSVAQIGYIFMGIGMGTRAGLFAALFHILAHAVAKSGLFLVSGGIIHQTENRSIEGMGGIGIRMPVSTALFAIGALSMIGVPFFAGFNSKWNFAMAAMENQQYWLMVILAISTLLNALYYLPILVRAYFGSEARALSEAKRQGQAVYIERSTLQLLPVILLAVCVIGAALFGGLLTPLIEAAVGSVW